MLGAAVGGIVLGSLGDRIGRTRAMGISILFYSVFAGLGAFVQTQEQMLVLRFLVGLGVGGMWPNGVALVSECWPNTSRPVVAGVMGAGVNGGILLLSQIGAASGISRPTPGAGFSAGGGPGRAGHGRARRAAGIAEVAGQPCGRRQVRSNASLIAAAARRSASCSARRCCG